MCLNLWDTAGSKRYDAITKNYLRDAFCVVCAYGVANPKSLDRIHTWLEQLHHYAEPQVRILVGCKADQQSVVSLAVADEFCTACSFTARRRPSPVRVCTACLRAFGIQAVAAIERHIRDDVSLAYGIRKRSTAHAHSRKVYGCCAQIDFIDITMITRPRRRQIGRVRKMTSRRYSTCS